MNLSPTLADSGNLPLSQNSIEYVGQEHYPAAHPPILARIQLGQFDSVIQKHNALRSQ